MVIPKKQSQSASQASEQETVHKNTTFKKTHKNNPTNRSHFAPPPIKTRRARMTHSHAHTTIGRDINSFVSSPRPRYDSATVRRVRRRRRPLQSATSAPLAVGGARRNRKQRRRRQWRSNRWCSCWTRAALTRRRWSCRTRRRRRRPRPRAVSRGVSGVLGLCPARVFERG